MANARRGQIAKPTVARPGVTTAMHPAAQQQRAQHYQGYYNQRFYNKNYGVQAQQAQAPHQFSKTVDQEKNARPIYIGVAAIAILFGVFMIASAFMQPKIDPELRATLQSRPSSEIRAIIFCDNCNTQLENAGLTVIANYPAERAILVLGTGSTILDLESESWVDRIGPS